MGRLDVMIEVERSSRRNGESKKEVGERSTAAGGIKDDDPGYQDHVADQYKDIYLYLAAKYGRLNNFSEVLDQVSATEHASFGDIVNKVSPAGNTILHLAAKYGNKRTEAYITYIAATCPELILKKNTNGDTALHLAAKSGDVSMVTAMVQIHGHNLVREKNRRGNTALHEALNNGQEGVASYLIEEDPEIVYYQNNDEESALYLAAKAGLVNRVSSILEFFTDQERINELFKNKSPIQVALKNKTRDVLEVMLNKNPSFIRLRDTEGRSPLHHAVSLGYLEEVSYLLDNYAPCALQRDKSGSFPIHLASTGGHVDIISRLLQDFPDPGELLDSNGNNILHVAAISGRYNVVMFILNSPYFEELINMKNNQGNVPLHLATMGWNPKIVSALTWDKRVDIKLVNDKGMTALDAAEYYMSHNPSYPQQLTWSALKSAGTPRSLSGKTHRKTPTKSPIVDFLKERVNTLLLVSTLVATITFAAGFTMPGGYDSSDMNMGTATKLTDRGFHIFVLCDTIAMFCSLVVVVSLIFAQLGDLYLIDAALSLALPLLGLALTMMSMAFTAGIYIVVNKLRWLSIVVLVMGFTFLTILLILLVLLCMPITSSNWILRYISYYPFCLMILFTNSDAQD